MQMKEMAKNTYKFYKKNILKGKNLSPKAMFMLGYEANVDSKQETDKLRQYVESITGMYVVASELPEILKRFRDFQKYNSNSTIVFPSKDDWDNFTKSRFSPFFKLSKNCVIDTSIVHIETERDRLIEDYYSEPTEDELKKETLEKIKELWSAGIFNETVYNDLCKICKVEIEKEDNI